VLFVKLFPFCDILSFVICTALDADNTQQNGFEQGEELPITEAVELLTDEAVVEAVGSSVLMDIDSGRWTQ